MSSRKKLPDQPPYLKRRTFEQGRAEGDAAHVATCRLYCDALNLWRGCVKPRCRRHRCCLGEPTGCFVRGLPRVSARRRLEAQKVVIAGGARRRAPQRAETDRVVGTRLNARRRQTQSGAEKRMMGFAAAQAILQSGAMADYLISCNA